MSQVGLDDRATEGLDAELRAAEARMPRLPALLGLLLLLGAGLVWGISQGRQQASSDVAPSSAGDAPEAASSDMASKGEAPAAPVAPAAPDTAGLSTGIVIEGRASLGEPAPDFRLETPEGDRVSLSDFAGQPVLLNFWATWCAPCRAEMPYLEAVHAKHADQGLVVLGVNVEESTAVVAPYLEELGLTFPIALDMNSEVSNIYRVGSYPTSVLIDREGRIVNVKRGAFVNEPDLQLSLSMILPEID